MIKRLFDYLAASKAELAKVTWPSRRQTVRLTGLVVAFSLAFALVLGLVDLGFSTLLEKVIIKG